jgi:diamine N-acetyltransferase
MADITNFDAKNRHAEVGIVIARGHRQKGYALKALEQVVDYAARVVHLRQLYAIINADNEASLQLFRKAGFSDAATLNDWLYDGTSYHAAVVMQIFL